MFRNFKNADAVVHLARIRFPYTESGFNAPAQRWQFADIAGDAERFNQNIAMTNNVLAAAQAAGVKKIVCGSSWRYTVSTIRAPQCSPNTCR